MCVGTLPASERGVRPNPMIPFFPRTQSNWIVPCNPSFIIQFFGCNFEVQCCAYRVFHISGGGGGGGGGGGAGEAPPPPPPPPPPPKQLNFPLPPPPPKILPIIIVMKSSLPLAVAVIRELPLHDEISR